MSNSRTRRVVECEYIFQQRGKYNSDRLKFSRAVSVLTIKVTDANCVHMRHFVDGMRGIFSHGVILFLPAFANGDTLSDSLLKSAIS